MDIVPGVNSALRKSRLLLRVAYGASVCNDRFPIFGKRVVTLLERPEANNLEGAEIQNAIRDARTILAQGWKFRSPTEWMQRHAEKIRAYFRPIQEIQEPAQQAVERVRKNADVVAGVHIRHGDYKSWRGGEYYYPVSRYAEWMRDFAAQFPGRKVAFIVCSDEPRSLEEFPGLSVELGNAGSALGDMDALSRCDYMFGPKSTFTQWASFYGNTPLQLLYSANDALEVQKFQVSWLEA